MNKITLYITVFYLTVFGFSDATAQCSMSVANFTTGPNVADILATSYVQTFKPTCSGFVNTIVFPSIYIAADDFRQTGLFVECRVRDAAGNILGIAPRTDQWFPGATVTFTFACKNISLIAGITYQFELTDGDANGVPFPNGVVLLRRSNTASVYADGNCILDGTSFPNGDLYGWTVNLINVNIATTTATATQSVTTCGAFYNASNELITIVKPGTTNGISGTATAKLWVETTQPAQFVKRHYEITPVTNATTATGRVTLYFTQQEFTDFNAVNTTKLPTGPADATGIANLLIEKRPGTSSNGTGLPGTYTGTPVTINPTDADIVWNAGASRWEVTFDVTGFSGFFGKTTAAVLPVKWLSVTGNVASSGNATINWLVAEQNVANYEVQKSTDGHSFLNIGTVASKGNGQNNYSFTDATYLKGIGYYRIRQIDVDGRSSLSAIVKLGGTNEKAVSVYPVPARTTVVVTVPQTLVTTNATLFDNTGKQIRTILLTNTASTIDVSDLPSGIYVLRFTNGSTSKLVKE